jgi:hypothetical protein
MVEGKEESSIILEDDMECRTEGFEGLTNGEWYAVVLGA